jgi:hypothetical protein
MPIKTRSMKNKQEFTRLMTLIQYQVKDICDRDGETTEKILAMCQVPMFHNYSIMECANCFAVFLNTPDEQTQFKRKGTVKKEDFDEYLRNALSDGAWVCISDGKYPTETLGQLSKSGVKPEHMALVAPLLFKGCYPYRII